MKGGKLYRDLYLKYGYIENVNNNIVYYDSCSIAKSNYIYTIKMNFGEFDECFISGDKKQSDGVCEILVTDFSGELEVSKISDLGTTVDYILFNDITYKGSRESEKKMIIAILESYKTNAIIKYKNREHLLHSSMGIRYLEKNSDDSERIIEEMRRKRN